MLSVSTHSILADNKPLGDGRHGVAAGDELHHLCLAHGKTVAFLQYQALLGKPVANGTGVLEAEGRRRRRLAGVAGLSSAVDLTRESPSSKDSADALPSSAPKPQFAFRVSSPKTEPLPPH